MTTMIDDLPELNGVISQEELGRRLQRLLSREGEKAKAQAIEAEQGDDAADAYLQKITDARAAYKLKKAQQIQ